MEDSLFPIFTFEDDSHPHHLKSSDHVKTIPNLGNEICRSDNHLEKAEGQNLPETSSMMSDNPHDLSRPPNHELNGDQEFFNAPKDNDPAAFGDSAHNENLIPQKDFQSPSPLENDAQLLLNNAMSASLEKSKNSKTQATTISASNNTTPSKPNNKPPRPKSPLPTHNKFGPLNRPSKSASTISTSLSGPLHPPGFEDRIPLSRKSDIEKKRKKKLQKKAKKRLLDLSHSSYPSSNNQYDINLHHISPSDVMKMAKIIGLSFNGSSSELLSRIDLVLKNQKRDWESNLS